MPLGLGRRGEVIAKIKFNAKYLGGHKFHPKSTDTKVWIFLTA
jgi:hypothetical protein